MMKLDVSAITELKAVLETLEAWVKNPEENLYRGRSEKFGLLRREILGNWLLCAAGNASGEGKDYTFTNDPSGGDGYIVNRGTGEVMLTEHVFVPKHQKTEGADGAELIISAVQKKQAKGGKAYAEGKHLFIFCDGIGEWLPNRVGQEINGKHDFSSVWVAGLRQAEGTEIYHYWVTHLNPEHSPAVQVSINFPKLEWEVSSIQ